MYSPANHVTLYCKRIQFNYAINCTIPIPLSIQCPNFLRERKIIFMYVSDNSVIHSDNFSSPPCKTAFALKGIVKHMEFLEIFFFKTLFKTLSL